MNDIDLDEDMIAIIDQYDFDHYRCYNRLNRTRFYKWLVVMLSGDVEVHMFAVKTKRDRINVAVKEVMKASVDGNVMEVRDLVFSRMGGYTADWFAEKQGRAFYSNQDRGKWASEPYRLTDKMWHINCPVINSDVLSISERFRYCFYEQSSGEILDYLKMYKMHPRIELLAKAGVPHLTIKPGFVKQIEKDKAFMKFFSKNLAEIKERRHGVDVIRKAYKLGISLGEAESKINARRLFRGDRLPLSIDPMKALAYIREKKVDSTYAFCRYLENCQRLGLDIADTKNSFPKNFKLRQQIVRDECEALDRQARADLAAKMAKDLKDAAAKFKALEEIRGSFVVRIPRNDKDFRREGDKLKNCVGNGHYASKMARGETVIIFVRCSTKPSVPFVTVEYSPDQKKVLQCYAKHNSKPEAAVMKFVNNRLLAKAVAI